MTSSSILYFLWFALSNGLTWWELYQQGNNIDKRSFTKTCFTLIHFVQSRKSRMMG